jgi:hypothetical protein
MSSNFIVVSFSAGAGFIYELTHSFECSYTIKTEITPTLHYLEVADDI